MTDSVKAEAKKRQDYDSDPPRCFLCVYFKREPAKKYSERPIKGKGNTLKMVRVRLPPSIQNPLVDRCTFGNFECSPAGVCNAWRGRNGDILEKDEGK